MTDALEALALGVLVFFGTVALLKRERGFKESGGAPALQPIKIRARTPGKDFIRLPSDYLH